MSEHAHTHTHGRRETEVEFILHLGQRSNLRYPDEAGLRLQDIPTDLTLIFHLGQRALTLILQVCRMFLSRKGQIKYRPRSVSACVMIRLEACRYYAVNTACFIRPHPRGLFRCENTTANSEVRLCDARPTRFGSAQSSWQNGFIAVAGGQLPWVCVLPQ